MNNNLKYQYLENAYPQLLEGISSLIQKAKIGLKYSIVTITLSENLIIAKAKELCELSIIEKWDNQESDEFKALCATYYDIATLSPLPENRQELIFEIIKLISFGYLGENWHLVRQYLRNIELDINSTDHIFNWNEKLLNSSFSALFLLLKKDNWEELRAAVQLIDKLRNDQKEFEDEYLNNISVSEKKSAAAELIALYHFARSIELLSQYMINGLPNDIIDQINYHHHYAEQYSDEALNISLKMLIQYFNAFSKKLIRNSIWFITRGINSRVTRFNEFITQRGEKAVFEMLYPQREAILEQGLLNDAYDALVVNLPTSSGKTLIAEYRILKALNQFAAQGGWIAYVVPTRALVNQITIQLQKDLSPIGIKIEKLSGAIELDGFESSLLEADAKERQFDVLVTTYEKLNLLIRQGVGVTNERPLVLAVVDEAHNIEEETRGIGLELLLTTIKKDCSRANFLLLTPEIINSQEICEWLGNDRGHPIHLGLHWWQPNERIIGALRAEGSKKNFKINLKTLLTDKGTYQLEEEILIKHLETAPITLSKVYGASGIKKNLAALAARHFEDESLIVLARDPASTLDIAERIWSYSEDQREDDDVQLVRRYVETELGVNFPLSKFLLRRIAVHSSALPDEVKFLIEDLMVKGKLKVLVATTTIAQGINFPVSSIIMASYSYPFKKMPHRDFWNLVGRVGRAGQQNMGTVSIVLKNDSELTDVATYVRNAAESLQSQMVSMIQKALNFPDIDFETWLFREPKWSNLLQYISHLYKQTENLERFITSLEINLQSTLGFRQLNDQQKNYLRTNLRTYVSSVDRRHATLSDQTGFSTVSIRNLIGKLSSANINSNDWNKNQLFSNQNQSLQKLVGIMLETPEVRRQMEDLNVGTSVMDKTHIAKLITDWVSGLTISELSEKYFQNIDPSKSIESCTKAIYRSVANAATWGLAALQKMPNSGLNWNNLSENEKKRFLNLPSMIHYGVDTDEAVLMRKNNVPRTIASRLGQLYSSAFGEDIFNQSSSAINNWIKNLDNSEWNTVVPTNSLMSGNDYKVIWKTLSGVQ